METQIEFLEAAMAKAGEQNCTAFNCRETGEGEVVENPEALRTALLSQGFTVKYGPGGWNSWYTHSTAPAVSVCLCIGFGNTFAQFIFG